MVETINLLIKERKQLKLIIKDIRTYKEKVKEIKQNIKDIKILEQKQYKIFNDEFNNVNFENSIGVNENYLEYYQNQILQFEFLKDITKENIVNYKKVLK